MNGFTRHFFQRGHAILYLDQSAATQRDHSVLDGFLFQFDCRGADKNELADVIINFHHFIKTGAAFIACSIASGATAAFENFDGLGFFRRVSSFYLGLRRQGNFFPALARKCGEPDVARK